MCRKMSMLKGSLPTREAGKVSRLQQGEEVLEMVVAYPNQRLPQRKLKLGPGGLAFLKDLSL